MTYKEKSITILGLGYIGLPLSLAFCLHNVKIHGIDILPKYIDNLARGYTTLKETINGTPIQNILNDCIKKQLFFPSLSINEDPRNTSVYIITVGIPSQKSGLDFSSIIEACRNVAGVLKPGDLVMLWNMMVPGMSEERLLPVLEGSGLCAGEDFHVAYCTEGMCGDNGHKDFTELPVIISGISEEGIMKAKEIIKIISTREPVIVSNIRTAEAAKVIENAHRNVEWAFIQEIADLCSKIDVNIVELVDAVNAHLGLALIKPGHGAGRCCIPNALYYLMPLAEKTGIELELFKTARSISQQIPHKIVNQILEHLKKTGKEGGELKAAVFGFAIKDYCSDDRMTPVMDIVKGLMRNGVQVKVYDPCTSSEFFFKADCPEECLRDADCLLIAALQDKVEYHDYWKFRLLMNDKPIIFDMRNVIHKEEAEQCGFNVVSI